MRCRFTLHHTLESRILEYRPVYPCCRNRTCLRSPRSLDQPAFAPPLLPPEPSSFQPLASPCQLYSPRERLKPNGSLLYPENNSGSVHLSTTGFMVEAVGCYDFDQLRILTQGLRQGQSSADTRWLLSQVLRQQGTEMPGSGEYNKVLPKTGTFDCAGCATPLYKAETKFASGCGWPAL